MKSSCASTFYLQSAACALAMYIEFMSRDFTRLFLLWHQARQIAPFPWSQRSGIGRLVGIRSASKKIQRGE